MSEVELEEILEDYAAATPTGNDLKILQSAVEANPEYAAELADFAAARAVIKHAPKEELSEEEEERFHKSGMQNLRAVLNAMKSAPASEPILHSLTETAKAKGLNRSKFAAALGLSVSLVQYLEKRRLEFSSIPKALIARVAEVLETGEHLVAGYLNQSPVSTASANFKAAERPEDLQPKSFTEVVREDQQLSAAEKQTLLGL